jgi:hypothetical protein
VKRGYFPGVWHWELPQTEDGQVSIGSKKGGHLRENVATFDKNAEDSHQKGNKQRQKRTEDDHNTEDNHHIEDKHHHIEDDHHHIQSVTFDRLKENQLVTHEVAEDDHVGHQGQDDRRPNNNFERSARFRLALGIATPGQA